MLLVSSVDTIPERTTTRGSGATTKTNVMLEYQLFSPPACTIKASGAHNLGVSVLPKTNINWWCGHNYARQRNHARCATVQLSTTTTDSSSLNANGLLQTTGTATSRQERRAAQKRRSFRRRQAPITNGQRKTIRLLWPKHGLDPDYARRSGFLRCVSWVHICAWCCGAWDEAITIWCTATCYTVVDCCWSVKRGLSPQEGWFADADAGVGISPLSSLSSI